MSDEEMAEISKAFVPSNTVKNTQWALACFSEWRSARNKSFSVGSGGQRVCPVDLLENPVVEDLNYWLSRFVAEVRNQEGKPYSPRSIHQILCGLQRHMLHKNPTAPKILNKEDVRFVAFRSAVDNVFHKTTVTLLFCCIVVFTSCIVVFTFHKTSYPHSISPSTFHTHSHITLYFSHLQPYYPLLFTPDYATPLIHHSNVLLFFSPARIQAHYIALGAS